MLCDYFFPSRNNYLADSMSAGFWRNLCMGSIVRIPRVLSNTKSEVIGPLRVSVGVVTTAHSETRTIVGSFAITLSHHALTEQELIIERSMCDGGRDRSPMTHARHAVFLGTQLPQHTAAKCQRVTLRLVHAMCVH